MLTIEPVRMNRNIHCVQPLKLSFGNSNFKTEEINFQKIEVQKPVQTIGYTLACDKTRLGANYNSQTKDVEFKLMSKNATNVFLCVFDKPLDENAKMTIPMSKNPQTNLWETAISYKELGNKPFYYGYRVFGPNWEYTEDFFNKDGTIKNSKAGFKSIFDEKGNRFNPNKIAHDPYSRELSHLPAHRKNGDLRFYSSNLFEDSAKYAPKTVFSITENKVISKAQPRALTDEIIGEVHMKDLTINEKVKGAGGYLGAKNFVKKLKDSGITMVEFLPVCEFDNNSCGNNHWGYMTLGFFAPAKRYAYDKTPGGALREFREMVQEFHKQNIKVCMDVVYNHTGEASNKNDNPLDTRQFSFSLIDNSTYYKQQNGVYNSNSGCGNDTNVTQQETMDFIADSIAYWANQGVDAFRFDLAVGLMDVDKTSNVQYDPKNSLIGKLTEMLSKRGIKVNSPNENNNGIYLIAEPWTCGGKNSYQLGKFPSQWAQWNDVIREVIKKDSIYPYSITPLDLKNVLEGSHNVLGEGDKSINYVYSHDGYNLVDNNTTKMTAGSSHITSDYNNDKNCQLMMMKKQIALILLAKGTPMLQIGDIIGHSKQKEHNSYNQDNEINYLNFSKTNNKDSLEAQIYEFSKQMINFRKQNPTLKESEYNSKITYYKPNGSIAQAWDDSYWKNVHSNILSYKIDSINSLFISTSSDNNEIELILPEPKKNKKWHLVCDTSKNPSFVKNQTMDKNIYIQKPHSLLIFEER